MPATDDEIREKYLERAIRELNHFTRDLQACRSRVKWLSSRIARSRYFSRISSSVAGIPPTGFTPPPGSPCPCKSTPAAPGDRLGDLPPAGRAAGGGWRGAGLQELQ